MTYVLYHANCDDGFGAAWAAWKKLRNEANYLPVQYSDPVPDIPEGAPVYILDFSYSRDVLMTLSGRNPLIVLDHHKTSQEALVGLPWASFDMNKSGAVMAWEYFHPGAEVPLLLQYIQDRDLWRLTMPETLAISSALRSYPMDFETWDKIAKDPFALHAEGIAIERYIQRLVENLAKDTREETWQEGKCLVVNVPGQLASVVADYLITICDGPDGNYIDFIATYRDMKDRRLWSLRSRGDFDVSEVAKSYGGGGHKNAAGFTEITELP